MKHRIKILLSALCLGVLLLAQHDSYAQVAAEQQSKPFAKVPDPLDVSIYQVNLRAFSKEGNFRGVTERLDSIQALGVKVIYLMPFYPIGEVKSINSPYCIKDYTAVNPEFGTIDDLRALVDAAHSKDVAVIIDWVANHTAYDHKWVSNKSWYLQDSLGNIISPPGTGWNDVAQLNFSNQEMRQEMIRSMKYWVSAINIDGFRCDYADGPPFDFWQQAVDSLRSIKDRKLLLLAEGGRKDHYKAGFDFTFGFKFFETMVVDIYRKGKSVNLIQEVNKTDYAGAVKPTNRVVRYTTNHDVNLTEGTPIMLFGGKKGSLAVFVIAAYMKGIPMIYNGQEIGYNKRLEFFSRTPIDWSTADPQMVAEYKKLLSLYNNSNPIRKGELKTFDHDDVAVFTKELDGEKVLVISNLRDKPVKYIVPAELQKASWQDAFSNKAAKLNKQITLAPFTYRVLKSKS
jgi:glycosidase